MPSSDDCIEARNEVHQEAIKRLMQKGHAEFSAQEIVKYMPYDKLIKLAEEFRGKPIYRGAYSPYG